MPYYRSYFEANRVSLANKLIRLKNRKIYAIISSYLRENSAILELGVGRGFFADVCTDQKCNYYGIEASGSQCTKLAERGLKVTQCMVPPIPFESGKFSLVYSSHLIEHLPDAEKVYELLQECHRVLKSDALLALVFPNYLSMRQEFWNVDYTHHYPTTERRMTQLLSDAGFSLLRSVRFSGHYSDVRRYLVKPLLRLFPYRVWQFFLGWLVNKDLIYRAWIYLQEDILLIAKKGEEVT